MEYSETFRSEMVAKMMGPQAVSANGLSKRCGVRQSTLSRWLREAKLTGVRKATKRTAATPGRRQTKRWTAEEKLRVVKLAAGLEGSALGELLRREGLHEADLRRFDNEALAGMQARPSGPSPDAKRIIELERELRRKDKALAEAAAILILRKKVEALWGGEGEDMDAKSEPRS